MFCSVDAFWQQSAPLWEREQVAAGRRRHRATRLSAREIMTILILFQQSGYRHRCSFTDERPDTYTVKKLHSMKAAHEREAVSSRDGAGDDAYRHEYRLPFPGARTDQAA